MFVRTAIASAILLGVVSACGETTSIDPPADAGAASSSSSSGGSTSSSSSSSSSSGGSGADAASDSGPSAFSLTSSAFVEGGTIPVVHECTSAGAGAENKSPPLSFSGAPMGTMSFALVMRDLNFKPPPQNEPFIHWVIWDIPSSLTSLPEAVAATPNPLNVQGAKQAKFNALVTGYYGPCSLSSTNTYELTLYAIPQASISGITPATDKVEAAKAIEAAATASTKLSGKS